MRKIIVAEFVSLDGVMQAPGGPQEDTDGGFEHGGWSVPYWDDAVSAMMDKTMSVPFDLLLGRRTYEIFAAFWPTAGEEAGAGPLNRATKYVASRSLKEVTWQNSRLLEGDVADAVRRLKREDGPEIQVHGSSNLLQTLIAHDLVDEFRTLIYPVVLGQGKRLFGAGTVPRGLKLVSGATSPSGVMLNVYRPTGEVQTGSFG